MPSQNFPFFTWVMKEWIASKYPSSPTVSLCVPFANSFHIFTWDKQTSWRVFIWSGLHDQKRQKQILLFTKWMTYGTNSSFKPLKNRNGVSLILGNVVSLGQTWWHIFARYFAGGKAVGIKILMLRKVFSSIIAAIISWFRLPSWMERAPPRDCP